MTITMIKSGCHVACFDPMSGVGVLILPDPSTDPPAVGGTRHHPLIVGEEIVVARRTAPTALQADLASILSRLRAVGIQPLETDPNDDENEDDLDGMITQGHTDGRICPRGLRAVGIRADPIDSVYLEDLLLWSDALRALCAEAGVVER